MGGSWYVISHRAANQGGEGGRVYLAGNQKTTCRAVAGVRLAAALLAGAETAADFTPSLLATAETHLGLGLDGL